MSIKNHKEPNILAMFRLVAIIAVVIIMPFHIVKQEFQKERVQLQPEADNKIEVLKDFYDGKPVRRSEAFWEDERGASGWTIILETMAKKYGLNRDEVLNRLEDLGNQSLVWSPAYQPPTSK